MLFHWISISETRLGDHLYRWVTFGLQPAIVVEINDNLRESRVITTNSSRGFRLITLGEFKGYGKLRRAIYAEDGPFLRSIKLGGTTYAEEKQSTEEIIRNAYLLLDVWNAKPEYIKSLFPQCSNNFAYLCCTNSHEQLRRKLHDVGLNWQLFDALPQACRRLSILNETNDSQDLSKVNHECTICMDSICDIAFTCGHLVCTQCSARLNECHICRQPITRRIVLFYS